MGMSEMFHSCSSALDIVRHKLVTRIVNAYDKYDKERAEAREAQKAEKDNSK